MVYALDKDDGSLFAFSSAAEVVAHCKAVDVEDGFWVFFAEDGKPMNARFGQEHSQAGPAAYTLQQALSGRWLQERLAEVRTVEGCGLTTIAELVETWKTASDKRRAPGRRR